MSRLDQEPEVIQLASELGVDWRRQPVTNILEYCIGRIRKWIKDVGQVLTIADLEWLICGKLQLVIEEVWSDEDLDRVMQKYIALGEVVFATLRSELDDTTFAALFRREHASAAARDRFVAVIDCRGDKAARRFFTRWHEIAHMLTLARQLEFPCHRSGTAKPPLERLMDTIAGEVGFYEPIFNPALEASIKTTKRLTFQAVDEIRLRFCGEASFQSTLLAAVRRATVPAVYLECGLGYKNAERAFLNAGQGLLLPEIAPQPRLRVLNVTPNDAARKVGLRVDRNMLVPQASGIAKLSAGMDAQMGATVEGEESLSIWRHSDGICLGELAISIQGRAIRNSIIAIVQPAP